jgi:hypothetical protein
MGEVINIPTGKIVFDKSIYPRFEVDPERIQFFVELLENEAELDPIRVVKHDGSYVLIEGRHRWDAHKICGIYEIPGIVEKIERKLWRLYAAKYNLRTAKPLSGAELKRTIERVYEIDGIRDTNTIADELGCTGRYVRRVLQEKKGVEKQKKIVRARQLRHEGLSLQEIADGLSEEFNESLTKVTVRNYLTNDAPLKNGTVPFFNDLVTNSTPEPPAEQPFSQENRLESVDLKSVTSTPQYDLEDPAESDSPTLRSPNHAGAEDASHVPRTTPEPSEPRRVIIDPSFLLRAVAEFKKKVLPSQQKTLVALHMLLCDCDVDGVARQVEEPLVWVRKTAAAVALIHMENSKEEILEKIDIDENCLEIIGFVHSIMPQNLPPLNQLLEWLNTNSKYHEELNKTVRREVISHCFKKESEADCDLPEPFSEIPHEISQGFVAAENHFREVLRLLELKQFQGDLLEEVARQFNGLQPSQNEIREVLRKLI